MRTTIVAALLLTLAAPAARADEADALSVELAKTVMPKTTYDQLLETVDAQLEPTMKQALANMAPDVDTSDLTPVFAEEMRKMLRAVMPTYEEISAVQARLLAKHYTLDELKQLQQFYRSPLGQKTIRIMPEVTKDAMSWMQSSLMKRMPAAMKDFQAAMQPKIEEFVKTHGKK
jgi:hypothetical protein